MVDHAELNLSSYEYGVSTTESPTGGLIPLLVRAVQDSFVVLDGAHCAECGRVQAQNRAALDVVERMLV